MTEKKGIKKIYTDKVKKLIKFNKAYFEKDQPITTDHDFDNLKKELINLEKKYSFLKVLKGVEDSIGFKPSNKFEKIKHSKQMLSLGNAFNKHQKTSHLNNSITPITIRRPITIAIFYFITV